MTAPLRDGQVVLCKFLACYLFYVLLLLPTLLYLPLLLDLHGGAGWPRTYSPWSVTLLAGIGVVLLGIFCQHLPRRLGMTAFVAGNRRRISSASIGVSMRHYTSTRGRTVVRN